MAARTRSGNGLGVVGVMCMLGSSPCWRPWAEGGTLGAAPALSVPTFCLPDCTSSPVSSLTCDLERRLVEKSSAHESKIRLIFHLDGWTDPSNVWQMIYLEARITLYYTTTLRKAVFPVSVWVLSQQISSDSTPPHAFMIQCGANLLLYLRFISWVIYSRAGRFVVFRCKN